MNAMGAEVHTLTGAYVCDALDETERAAFEAHLARCQDCAQEVAELRETVAELGMAAAADPPPQMRAAVDAALRVTRQLPPTVTQIGQAREQRERRRRNRAAWAGWAVAAALAGVVAGLSIQNVSQQHVLNTARHQLSSASAQSAALASLLSAPDAHSGAGGVRGGGTALVVVSRSRDEAAITLADLSEPPSGKAYQLWMIGPDGMRSGGVVAVDAHGTTGPILAKGLGDAQSVGLTVEPASGSQQPTTAPILLLPMPA